MKVTCKYFIPVSSADCVPLVWHQLGILETKGPLGSINSL